LNVGSQYEVPVGSDSLVIAAEYSHSAKWYGTPENRTYQKAYNLVNASATCFMGHDKRYSLRLWGRNLGNVSYADQIVIEVPVADYAAPSEGRTFGVTLGLKY
jgi:outer membrane receptor protein involved in Fe transport